MNQSNQSLDESTSPKINDSGDDTFNSQNSRQLCSQQNAQIDPNSKSKNPVQGEIFESTLFKGSFFCLKAIIEVLLVISIISAAVAESDKQAEQAIIQTLQFVLTSLGIISNCILRRKNSRALYLIHTVGLMMIFAMTVGTVFFFIMYNLQNVINWMVNIFLFINVLLEVILMILVRHRFRSKVFIKEQVLSKCITVDMYSKSVTKSRLKVGINESKEVRKSLTRKSTGKTYTEPTFGDYENLFEFPINGLNHCCEACEQLFAGHQKLVIVRECLHQFHIQCLKKFIAHNGNICPKCKQSLVTKKEVTTPTHSRVSSLPSEINNINSYPHLTKVSSLNSSQFRRQRFREQPDF